MRRMLRAMVALLLAGLAAAPALAQTGVDPHARAYQRSLEAHLTLQQALVRAEEHLRAVGPAGARLGRAEESEVAVTAEVLGPDGRRAGLVVVDRRTGWVRTEP